MVTFWAVLTFFLMANCVANAKRVGESTIQAGFNVNDKIMGIVRDEEDDTLQPRQDEFKGNTHCPCGSQKIGNGCYLFVKNKVTWDSARADCLNRGGDLVVPTSNTECDLLSQRAHSLGMNIPWIGASRRRQDAQFYNTCGKALSFTRWNRGEPNNSGNNENCVHMFSQGSENGTWNDANCNSKYGYICQFKAHRCD